MNDIEKAANDLLLLEIKKIKENCFSMMRILDRSSKAELESAGYRNKTNAEAMQMSFRRYWQDVENAIKAHEKKYPD